jgi:hypothetical protein
MPTNLTALRWKQVFLVGVVAWPMSVAFGSLMESRNWAVTGDITTAAGYDTNLTLTRDGPDDAYVQARPRFSVGRRNSSSDFHVDASATGTLFINDRQPKQSDYLAGVTYAYPFAENVVPLYKSNVSWARTSEPDQYLGRRIRHNRASASAEGYLSLSGKLGLRGEADVYDDDFDATIYNRNRRWRTIGGVAYSLRPRLQSSLNVGYAEGRSRPNLSDAGLRSVRSEEVDVTARFRGEITSKITGSLYFGYGEVRYKGGYSNRYGLPVAGADLTWGIDPRRTVVLACYSGTDYAPDGQAVDNTRAFLSFTHVIIGHWQYIVRGGPTRMVFRREVRQSTDTAWTGGLEFAYTPSDRFRVAAGVNATHHQSGVRDRQYDQGIFSIESTYRF